MAKLTLHELMKEMADDEGLTAEDRERASELAGYAHPPKAKDGYTDLTRLKMSKTEPRR